MAGEAYMTDLPIYPGAEQPYPIRAQRERVAFLTVLIFCFIAFTTGSAGRFPWNYVIKITGAVLVLTYVVRSIIARIRLSPEVFLYLAWIIWSTTGLVAGANLTLYVTSVKTIFQMWLLLLILCASTTSRKALSISMFAFLAGAGWVWLNAAVTGSFEIAMTEGERASGMSMNPNGFGRIMVSATVAMAYFWMLPSRLGNIKQLLLVLGMIGAAGATVLSASRFSILGLVVFYLLWIWICYRKEVLRRPSVLMVIVLGLALGGTGFVAMMARTAAGARMSRAWQRVTGTAGGAESRIEIYKEAVGMVARSPLFGVGLNNFRLRSSVHRPAHSEYAEVAAATGLPGVVIYFAIYFLLWRRAGKVAKYSTDPSAVRIARLIRVFMLTVLFVGLGAPNYYSKPAWILLGSFIGYTYAVQPARFAGAWQGAYSPQHQ